MEQRLLNALNSDAVLDPRGVRARSTEPFGIVVADADGEIGVWTWTEGLFTFTRAGTSATLLEVETVAEAVIATQRLTGG